MCGKQFQILHLIDWEAVEFPTPLPLKFSVLKSLLQPLSFFPALVITCAFSFPCVVRTERRDLEWLNSRARIHFRPGLHFRRVSARSKLAGWECCSFQSIPFVSIFRSKCRTRCSGESPARATKSVPHCKQLLVMPLELQRGCTHPEAAPSIPDRKSVV